MAVKSRPRCLSRAPTAAGATLTNAPKVGSEAGHPSPVVQSGRDSRRKHTRGSPHLSMARPASLGAGQAPREAVMSMATGGVPTAAGPPVRIWRSSPPRQADDSNQTRPRQPRPERVPHWPGFAPGEKPRFSAAWLLRLVKYRKGRIGCPHAHSPHGTGCHASQGRASRRPGGRSRSEDTRTRSAATGAAAGGIPDGWSHTRRVRLTDANAALPPPPRVLVPPLGEERVKAGKPCVLSK